MRPSSVLINGVYVGLINGIYVGVPPPEGNTDLLRRCCGAREVGEFVDAELLHGVLMAQFRRTPG